jgi:hypothetical protein
MGDVRDFAAFIRGRWDWKRHGYEDGFPGTCGFTDIDAAVEFGGHHLFVEAKHHDGTGPCDYPATGQLLALRDLVKRGITVFVLYGCATCNDPQALRVLAAQRGDDRWVDWRGLGGKEDRRKMLKYEIDHAMGLV